MGCCESAEIRLQREQNNTIEKQLEPSQRRSAITRKLLLLAMKGAAECGKSTILKQMRIIHDNGFTTEEFESIKRIIRQNVIEAMGILLQQIEILGIVPTCKHTQQYSQVLRKEVGEDETFGEVRFSTEIYIALKTLWNDGAVQECYSRRSEFHLPDCTKYFLDDLERIAAEQYIPNNQDVLYTRAPTNGVVELTFTAEKALFRVFDVGGQRSERRKWIHCFDNVNAIIFLCAISEFDQKLMENNETNRLLESLYVFKQIVNNELFASSCSMILFLNKTDLFAEKIKFGASITTAFPTYSGLFTFDAQVKFIQKKFESQNRNPKKLIYVHETCATDTNQVESVLEDVVDTIMRNNITATGLA